MVSKRPVTLEPIVLRAVTCTLPTCKISVPIPKLPVWYTSTGFGIWSDQSLLTAAWFEAALSFAANASRLALYYSSLGKVGTLIHVGAAGSGGASASAFYSSSAPSSGGFSSAGASLSAGFSPSAPSLGFSAGGAFVEHQVIFFFFFFVGSFVAALSPPSAESDFPTSAPASALSSFFSASPDALASPELSGFSAASS